MQKIFSVFFLLFTHIFSFAQKDTAVINKIKRFQDDLIKEYKNDETSPLSKEAKENFKGIHFYPVDLNYIVTAKFVRTSNEKIFAMPTSGSVTKSYVKYGEAQFEL